MSKTGLYLFCRDCDRVREHARTPQATLKCKKCKAERPENSDRRVRNAFGDKGRGF